MVKKIAIIGTGIAGMTLAERLSSQYDVTLFEKSKSVGGRMTHRYHNDFDFDHGAQYFTAKSSAFKFFIKYYYEQGVISPWDARFVDYDEGKLLVSRKWNEQHWVAQPSMNALVKAMMNNHDIRLNHRVTAVNRVGEYWKLLFEEGEVAHFDMVMFAIPAAQCCQLMPRDFAFYPKLSEYSMSPCYSLMLGLDNSPNIDWDVAHIHDPIISWISVNSSKPGRTGSVSVVVQSTNDWAQENFELNFNEVQSIMLEKVMNILNVTKLDIAHVDLHRWRYANSPKCNGPLSYYDECLGLGVCGDWLQQGRVEAAFLSASNLSVCLSC